MGHYDNEREADRAPNILHLPIKDIDHIKAKDIRYITGNTDRGEPTIVGVRCEDISIQLSVDLYNVLLGDIEVKREELIAFIIATDIHNDFVKELK